MALFFYKEKNKDIRAAAYLRLSIEDGDKAESNSIGNQRELIRDFAAERPGLHLVEEYADDGYTGTNFDRPGFQQMMDGVRNGKIDTIIVKDLSRFGRDYIGVGEYMEQIFPLLGVRLIAINDNYDSNNYKGTTLGMDVVVSNLVNTMYCRDAGKKLRTANQVKWRKGITTASAAPFGYQFDPDKKGAFIVDPPAAKIVRRIFDLAILGLGTREIAMMLNDENVPVPSVYNKENKAYGKETTYIKEYINHRDDLMLLDVFADKRCTGMNFDRPEFERLLKALQERKVNCIVVKDFSRLGRNFVETGQYLEQVFPLFGVRVIAINDNYDSLNSQSRDGMLVPIKSMINEMYSKDLSKKIQSCFRSKEARGEIYTPVPFGYKRNQQNHLILDEEVSDVVVRIFLWKKSGMKEREIAKKLSAQGIPTPFTRRCQLGYLKNTLRVKDPAWQTVFVTKVLENPIYTGTMVYNRIAYDETYRKIGRNPRESWRMVPDSHPAIISWELFDEVSALREAEQAVREERKKWCRQRRESNPNIFKGRIFCKECGEKLFCHWQSDGSLYFYCASCHVSISEKDLWNGINKELHQRMEEHRDLQKLVRKSSGKSKLQSKEIATKREIEQASGNIVRLESQKRSGYEQYVLGKISKEKFLELKQDAENEIEAFRQTKAENEKELVVVQEELRQKKQIADNTEVLLTADNLQQYVKKIEVDREKITCTEFSF